METFTPREIAFLLMLLEDIDKAPRPLYKSWKRKVTLDFTDGEIMDFDIVMAKLRRMFSAAYGNKRLTKVHG